MSKTGQRLVSTRSAGKLARRNAEALYLRGFHRGILHDFDKRSFIDKCRKSFRPKYNHVSLLMAYNFGWASQSESIIRRE